MPAAVIGTTALRLTTNCFNSSSNLFCSAGHIVSKFLCFVTFKIVDTRSLGRKSDDHTLVVFSQGLIRHAYRKAGNVERVTRVVTDQLEPTGNDIFFKLWPAEAEFYVFYIKEKRIWFSAQIRKVAKAERLTRSVYSVNLRIRLAQ
jgi:hypothetical protein